MAVENSNTYTLAPEVAASLRLPLIDYPGGIVPHAVIRQIVIDPRTGLTAENYPALGDKMHVSELVQLIEQHSRKGVH